MSILGFERGAEFVPSVEYQPTNLIEGTVDAPMSGAPGADEMPVDPPPATRGRGGSREDVDADFDPSTILPPEKRQVIARPAPRAESRKEIDAVTQLLLGDYVSLSDGSGKLGTHEVNLIREELEGVRKIAAGAVARQLREEMERVLASVQQPERQGAPMQAPSGTGVDHMRGMPAPQATVEPAAPGSVEVQP